MSFDPKIGVHDEPLAGGQKQRIFLALVFLKKPPILKFDAAASTQNRAYAAAFVESRKRMISRRIHTLIDHQPASLALADRMLQLSKRRIMAMVSAA